MATVVPVFRMRGQTHRADTCEALVMASRRGEVKLEALVRGSYPGHAMPRGVLPGVRTVGFWDARHDQDWGLPEHRNEGIELTYLESGQLGFFVEGRACPLRPGNLTVTRPWQPHRVGNPNVGAGRLYWLILDVGVRQPHQRWQWPAWLVLSKPDLADLTAMLRHNEQPVWPGTAEVGQCFARIGRLLSDGARTPALASRLALHVNELLVCVLELLRRQDVPRQPELTSAQRTVEMVLQRLGETLDQPWTLEAMAKHAGLKRTRFAHYCRKLTNLTPLQYLAQRRVARAKDLLRDESLSVTDIALRCGFATSQYFSTTFRRLEGVAPREWRGELEGSAGVSERSSACKRRLTGR